MILVDSAMILELIIDSGGFSIASGGFACDSYGFGHVSQEFGNDCELAFANGGDQSNETIPEVPVCEELGIALIDGLGAKIQSSSWLLEKEG